MDAGRHAGGLVVGTTRPDGSGRSLPPTAAIAGLAGGADTGLLAHVLAWAVASGREADTMGWLYGGIVVVVLALCWSGCWWIGTGASRATRSG